MDQTIPCSVLDCRFLSSSLLDLLNHFSEDHKMKSFHPVNCRYDSCTRSFTNQRFFVKHFNLKHGKFFSTNTNISEHDNSETFVMTPSVSMIEEAISFSGAFVPRLPPKVDATVQNKSSDFSGESAEKVLEERFLDFSSTLQSKLTLPFSHAEEIVKSVVDVIGTINCVYKEQFMLFCNNTKSEDVKNIMPQVEKKFEWVESTFNKYATTYRVKKALEDKGFFVPPVRKFLGWTRVRKRIKKKNQFRRFTVKGTAAFIPLRQVLTVLFEQEGVLESVLNYMQSLNSDDKVISNFVQGQCWINTPESDTGITLPLEYFNDDLEVGNVIGSHSGVNKINASYISIPCFVPEVRSSRDYMFLAFLTKASNLKYFKLKTVFKSLIDELDFLADTGITVNIGNQKVKLFFQLCIFCGDNLGLNTLGGFCQNFSTGKYNCRFCLAGKLTRRMMTKEKPHLRRTEQNYRAGVRLQDVSKTGIHNDCPFNSIKNFHIINNGIADVFHDIFEGVAVYDLCFLLKHYIFVTGFFTVSTFNERLADFNFGCDLSNKPPPLSVTFSQKKGKLRMSGSETACLVKYLGLLIGDLVPSDDPVWELYVALRKVVDLVLSPSFRKDSFKLLELYVHEHNILYISHAKKPLTPKFHNLVHYSRLIAHFAPLIHLAVPKYERKHRDVKAVTNSVATRRDICMTAATKYQMKLGRDFYTEFFTKQKILRGPNLTHKNYDNFFSQIDSYTFTTPFPTILRCKNTIRSNWVELHGTKYNTGCTLYLDIDERTSFPLFGLLKHIFLSIEGKVYFLLQNFQTLGFSQRFYAFRVLMVDSYSIYSQDQIHDFHPQNAASPAMLPDSELLYVSLLKNS